MTKALKVKDLNVVLGGEEIIKDLSFSVEDGEVLVVMGPNGAGKTTLLKALLGLVPSKGKVEWGSKNISYLPPQEFLERRHLPPLSIKDFFELKGASSNKTTEMLELVGLKSSIISKNFNTLSTGQFQRMIIAWALVNEPSILLFDEPTAGIDVGGEETIYSLLRKFWEDKKMTILLVTHDLSIIWEHANNVLCINKKKICYGKPRKVLTPKNLEELYGTGIKFYKHGGGK
ncbi:ATP-binding cassette domain-containing protein [archaeon]|nr:ATP-binding cassette domain-containing protein [archaeon]